MDKQDSVSIRVFITSTLTVCIIAIGIFEGYTRFGNALMPHPIWVIPAVFSGGGFIWAFHQPITDIYKRLFKER